MTKNRSFYKEKWCTFSLRTCFLEKNTRDFLTKNSRFFDPSKMHFRHRGVKNRKTIEFPSERSFLTTFWGPPKRVPNDFFKNSLNLPNIGLSKNFFRTGTWPTPDLHLGVGPWGGPRHVFEAHAGRKRWRGPTFLMRNDFFLTQFDDKQGQTG